MVKKIWGGMNFSFFQKNYFYDLKNCNYKNFVYFVIIGGDY